MAKKTIDAPVPILQVLHATLAAVGKDKRFRSVPNGHLEVAWKQPTTRVKGDERPERYVVSFECMFVPAEGGEGE